MEIATAGPIAAILAMLAGTANTVAGLQAVSSGLDVAKLLGPMGIPKSGAAGDVGAFRFLCGPGQILPDDPIVYPGQPGKAHLHQFFGNLGANANSTYKSLRSGGESTCQNELNRSAYWMPAMLDGKGNAVRPDTVSIYYKRRPKTDPLCTQLAKACADIPRGFRLIFGWDQTRPNEAQPENIRFNFRCEANGQQVGDVKLNMADVMQYCKAGQQLVAGIATPICWDGINLDSPNHRSHVSDATYGVGCPKSHPYWLPQFSMGVQWTIGAGDDPKKWTLASDHMKPGARAGETFHADYFEAWEDSVRDRWHKACIGKLLDCSDGDLGDGQIMNRGKYYPYGTANPRLVAVPVMKM